MKNEKINTNNLERTVNYERTFRLGFNFPARANISVVFPEAGGPNKSVILQ